MRYGYGIGFLALLIGVAIWLSLSAKDAGTAAKKNREIRDQAQPWTHKTADGQTAQQSVKLDGESNGGSLNDLLVTDVTPGGYFDQYYGLQKGDKILQIGGIDVAALGGEEMAEAKVWEASTTGSGTLTVLRNNQKITLSSSNGTLGGGRRAPGAATPSTPSTPSSPAPPATPAAPGAPPAAPASPANPTRNGAGGQTYPGAPGIRIPQIPQPE